MTVDAIVESLLNEGLSAILYHRTPVRKAYSILKQNQFNLGKVKYPKDKRRTGKQYPYYFSTARSKLGKYTGYVTLVLDGRKLGQRYKGQPFDYFATARKNRHATDEMEDRIWSDKPVIPNAAQYIKELHLLYADDIDQFLQNFVTLSQERGIDVYVYWDTRGYLLLNKKKAEKNPDYSEALRTVA